MAGIGFSLKKLFSQKGLVNLCKAYGYAGLICAGPMILGVTLLTGVSLVSGLAGIGRHESELLNAMLTYSLLAALTVTSFFNMVTTHYVSDMLYEERPERVLPSFHGCLAVMMPLGLALWAVFLCFSGTALVNRVLCFIFVAILMVVWTQMNYLNALKDYKVLVLDFALALSVGFMTCALMLMLHAVTMVTLFAAVIAAYGVLMVLYYVRLLEFFPVGEGSSLLFLAWFERYGRLVVTGVCVHVGLFAHLVIMFYGPLGVQVEGLFRGAPLHDVAALCAFFSILVTTVNFVTSVETNFYPRYHTYYSLFNDQGSIKDIDQAEGEMLAVLRRELVYNGCKQLFTSLIFIVAGSIVLQNLPLGITDTSLSIFRNLCVGYGLYALANTIMLVLLYFEDYGGALVSTALFAVLSVAGTLVQAILFPAWFSAATYGLGFALGAAAFYLAAYVRLEWYTRRLPYHLLGRQALVPVEHNGPLTRLCRRLEPTDGKA